MILILPNGIWSLLQSCTCPNTAAKSGIGRCNEWLLSCLFQKFRNFWFRTNWPIGPGVSSFAFVPIFAPRMTQSNIYHTKTMIEFLWFERRKDDKEREFHLISSQVIYRITRRLPQPYRLERLVQNMNGILQFTRKFKCCLSALGSSFSLITSCGCN